MRKSAFAILAACAALAAIPLTVATIAIAQTPLRLRASASRHAPIPSADL